MAAGFIWVRWHLPGGSSVKLSLFKEEFIGQALNLCEDLLCLVQHLSTRFSKHNCQMVIVAIPLLLLKLLYGKEELLLLLGYLFLFVSVWTHGFLRETKS